MSLLREQGHLCAYTGRRIRHYSFHIEHLKAQTHCATGEDIAYNNIVACYPEPNHPESVEYGAQKKGSWPDTENSHLFLSPLDSSCGTRLTFNLRGKILADDNDQAAQQTIENLGLNHQELIRLRHDAIRGVLGQNSSLRLQEARRRLRLLENATGDELEPFCFVLIAALKKHIHRLETIRRARTRAT